LVPAGNPRGPRILGSQKGRFEVPKDFDAPLPEEIQSTFQSWRWTAKLASYDVELLPAW